MKEAADAYKEMRKRVLERAVREKENEVAIQVAEMLARHMIKEGLVSIGRIKLIS